MISRRQILTMGALTALGAGWPGGVLRALAQAPAGPRRRLLIISHCHGWPYADWQLGRPSSTARV